MFGTILAGVLAADLLQKQQSENFRLNEWLLSRMTRAPGPFPPRRAVRGYEALPKIG